MKKIILGAVFLLISTTGIISCKKQVELKPVKESLNSRLLTFNNNLPVVSSKANCSGFWDCLGYAASIAGADIAGAAAGGVGVAELAGAVGVATGGTGAVVVIVGGAVITGAGASYAAGLESDPRFDRDNLSYGNLNIHVPAEFVELSNVGEDHNTVIHNYFVKSGNIDDYKKNLFTPEQLAVFNSSSFTNMTNSINDASRRYVQNDFDVKTLTSDLVNAKTITTNMKDVLDLFLDRYVRVGSFQEIESLVNFYISEVSRSQSLTKIEKQSLICSFLVASESPFYLFENE